MALVPDHRALFTGLSTIENLKVADNTGGDDASTGLAPLVVEELVQRTRGICARAASEG
ncbi:MAG: hypothetical protein GY812_13510 [Actinomycetia bacterium]|nr:hypothetical protein [Actinomycetes bacterium]